MAKSRFSNTQFNKQMLPSTRKQMFFDIFKLHFFKMLGIGVIAFLFLAPLLGINIIKDISYITAYNTEGDNRMLLVVLSIIEIPAMILFFVFLAGVGKVDREYIWLEPVFFKNDFLKGVKDNLKPSLLLGLLFAITNFIFQVSLIFSGNINNNFLIAIPFGLCFVVFYPIFIHTLMINFVYTNKFNLNLKLGVYLYIKHIPTSLIFGLILIVFNLMNFFHFLNPTMLIIKYFVLIILIVFLVPFIFIAIYLNEMRIFDIRFNSVRFPSLLNKGLYKEDAIKNEQNMDSSESKVE